ncbi:MAG: GIY-YIG nuclease family protein [Candidatus Jorgensenbacteria bacterium]|nr:GIY-YIG nuclease family protein [Candidatus Jorgensenbacteria bacterium]
MLRDRLPAQAGLMVVCNMWYVYIIKSKQREWYYTGSTNRLDERLCEHNSGRVKSTKPYKPFELVFTRKFELEKEAREYEHKVKDCRIEKETIIRQIENHCGIV